MSCHGERSFKDYLVVEPKKGGLSEVFKLLWSHEDLKERSFLDRPEKPEGKKLTLLRYRWMVFISVVTQKILLYSKTPMACVGCHLCFFLNAVSSNGGLLRLFLNYFTGKVVKPDPESSTFRSVMGNIDSRFDLDPSIVVGDPRYNAALSIMAARLSYENDAFIKMVVEQRWQMTLLSADYFWNDFLGELATRAIMFKDPNRDPKLIVVSFRGTDPFDAVAMRTDVDISWYKLQDVGKIHSGFMKALGLQKNTGWPKEIEMGQAQLKFAYYTIRDRLKEELQRNKDAKFMLTGHSLGGALAILMAGILMLHGEKELLHSLEGVYTFGQPRVGDSKFGEFMKEKLRAYNVKYCRYVYCNDIVPRMPYDDTTLVFKHFGPCVYYNSLYKGKVIEEVPNKNYFSVLWMIPEFLNAIWELIRGVILPWMEGPTYREGWLLTAFRLIGLILPGLADHGPQDYHNITRLGVLSSHMGNKYPIHNIEAKDPT